MPPPNCQINQNKKKVKLKFRYITKFWFFFFSSVCEKSVKFEMILQTYRYDLQLCTFLWIILGDFHFYFLCFCRKVFKAFKFSNIKKLLNTFNWQFSISFYRFCNKDFVCSQLLTLSTESWQFQHHLTRVSLIQLTLKRSWIKNRRVKLTHIIWTIPFELWTRTRGQKGCSCLELSWQL